MLCTAYYLQIVIARTMQNVTDLSKCALQIKQSKLCMHGNRPCTAWCSGCADLQHDGVRDEVWQCVIPTAGQHGEKCPADRRWGALGHSKALKDT